MTLNEHQQFKKGQFELLGIGAAKDCELMDNLRAAMRQSGIDVPVKEVNKIENLLQYGISGIPALLFDKEILFQKYVPSVNELSVLLRLLFKKEKQLQPVKRILVPTDFSDTARNAFRYALSLANVWGADIDLVHVLRPAVDVGVLAGGGQEPSQTPRRKMDLLFEEAFEAGIESSRIKVNRLLVNGQVGEEIRKLIHSQSVDLVIMGTTGESGMLGKWLGSTSTEVARKANCPVLLVPGLLQFSPYKQVVYAFDGQLQDLKCLQQGVELVEGFKPGFHLAQVEKQGSTYHLVQKRMNLSGVSQLNELFFNTIQSPDVLSGLSAYVDQSDADLLVFSTWRRSVLEDLFHRSVTRKMILRATIPILVLHY